MAIKPKAKKAETEAVDEKVETTEIAEETEQVMDENGSGESDKSENKSDEPALATKSKTGLVKVYNPNSAFLQQTSTGIRIRAKSVAEVADDSWLELQIRHKLLQRVK